MALSAADPGQVVRVRLLTDPGLDMTADLEVSLGDPFNPDEEDA